MKPNLESRVQEPLAEKVNVQGEQNQLTTLSLCFSFSPSKTLRRRASSQCERGTAAQRGDMTHPRTHGRRRWEWTRTRASQTLPSGDFP